MGCLYCGKEFGTFRLIRKSEFCSVLHRKKYGERLGKALHEIAAPEPAPAGVVGFRIQMPFQQGNLTSGLILWQTSQYPVRTRADWPLTIDTSAAISDVAPLPECAPEKCPPPSERWMPAPAPELVARFLQASAALAPAGTLRLPRFDAVLDGARHAPAAGDNWMPAPAPEPVAGYLQASAALAPACTVRLPRFAAGFEPAAALDGAPHAPAACDNWMPVPAPEPVAAFMQACAAPALTYALANTLRFPSLAAELAPVLELALDTPPVCNHRMPVAAPEPVAAFVPTSAALTFASTLCFPRLAVEPEPVLDLAFYTPPVCNHWMPVPAPEPVAPFVQTCAALAPAGTPRLPSFAAGFEPSAVLDRAPHAPAAGNKWMPVPAPEPVAAFMQARAALTPVGALRLPRFDPAFAPAPLLVKALIAPVQVLEPIAVFMPSSTGPTPADTPHTLRVAAELRPLVLTASAFALSGDTPRVPWITQPRFVRYAEPVIGAVRPSVTQGPVLVSALVYQEAVALPAIPQMAPELFAAERLAANAAAPEAVERLLVTTRAAVPVSITRGACPSVALAAHPAVFEPAPAMGRAVAGPAPDALESLLVAAMAAPVATAAAVRMLPFLLAVSQARAVPSFDARRLAPKARRPDVAASRLVPQPIATLAVATPARVRPSLESALPRPGLRPVEFLSHGLRSAPVARPEWIFTRPAVLPPQFLLGAVLEKLAEPAAQQRTPRPEVLQMPKVRRPPTVLLVAGRIAAGFLLATSLWFGVASFRGGSHQTTREEQSSGDVALAPANSAGSMRTTNGGAPAQPARKGPAARVGQAIADRATLKVAENFRGMANWGSAQAYPAGWSRHPDGYVSTGALALFRPSVRFADYRMEFFGQIEAKSIGWTVRAKDTRNYHAMKVTVVEAGIRPFVALVQYSVVNGKSGPRTQTPLNVMVHNNRPMQFAVDVRGNRFVTSIDGEEVDTFIDDTLVAGGVGFFSEAGEHARLYWMRFTRNDDWLGHVCAMLSEGAGVVNTAGLGRPETPGGPPAPGIPGDRDGMTLAAVWIGLPHLVTSRKARFLKTWRSGPWNT